MTDRKQPVVSTDPDHWDAMPWCRDCACFVRRQPFLPGTPLPWAGRCHRHAPDACVGWPRVKSNEYCWDQVRKDD